MEKSYYQQRYQKNIIKLRSVLKDLPGMCQEYFRGIEHKTSILTRVNYAYDLRLFFEFLSSNIEEFKDIPLSSFSLEHVNKIQTTHIEMFLEYITYYTDPDLPQKGRENHEAGKARKLSTLRSFFSYFFKKEKIDRNVAALVDLPRVHEKPIIRLDVDEVAKLLDTVESGEKLTKAQQRYHRYTRCRDLAILTLLLGTGIRISECIGLDINDVDFKINAIKVTRKGGDQVVLYFGEEVEKALLQYLDEREKMQPADSHEDALFLSLQKRRISNRAVQNLVKKYAKMVTPLKKITPHKLRSTYGTTLYQETGDIYLVADVLGHKDVNTTKKHYAAISDEKRRIAAKVVKLRDD